MDRAFFSSFIQKDSEKNILISAKGVEFFRFKIYSVLSAFCKLSGLVQWKC